MGISIDDIFDGKQAPENTSGTTDIAIVSKKKTKAVTDTSTKGMYARFQNLMYMIDKSGSTANQYDMTRELDYKWPEDLRTVVMRELTVRGGSDEINELLEEDVSVDVLKTAVRDAGPESFGIYKQLQDRDTIIGMIRESVSDLVDKKFAKFPDARVMLGTFHTDAYIEAATKDTIKIALKAMTPGGGTNIYHAISTALDYFEKYPSPVGVNHLVLVTDGEDWGAVQVEELKPRIKDLKVTLDYIYAKRKELNPLEGGTASEVAKFFKVLCTETGGEYVEVSSPEEFKQKLFMASERLCLPPGVE